jgi:hypothetical protein
LGGLDDDLGGRSWHGRVSVELRRRALDLVAAGKTVAEVAWLLEGSDQSSYVWRRQELIDRRPRFIDYLYLGFTNATAFSPTDVMALVPWAKIAMAIQSLVSLGILGLVIARAVNVFT